jgi:hypothetical protein
MIRDEMGGSPKVIGQEDRNRGQRTETRQDADCRPQKNSDEAVGKIGEAQGCFKAEEEVRQQFHGLYQSGEPAADKWQGYA